MSKAITISLHQGEYIYDLFKLGYMNEGFFITDLISSPSFGRKFGLKKSYQPNNIVGEYLAHPHMEDEVLPLVRPKFSYKKDGKVQISGKGMISGFWKFTGMPKGLGLTKSMPLDQENDGGPIITFNIRGVNSFPKIKYEEAKKDSKKRLVLEAIHCNNQPSHEKNSIQIVGYYKLKRKSFGIQNKHVDHQGIEHFLLIADSPDYISGILGFNYQYGNYSSHDLINDGIGFAFQGGAPQIDDNGFIEVITIIYPSRRGKSIDYKGWNKFKTRLLSTIDDSIYTIKRYLKSLKKD